MNNDIVKAFLADPVNGRLALSASLGNFIKFFHWVIYHQEFVIKPFHKEIIRKIEDIAFGRAKKRNLVINIPPRFGKSSIIKYACAWSYMLNPASNCIYTSYSDDLANDFSKEIRDIVESEEFKALTGLGFKKGKTGADYWVTSGGGGFRAAPMGGGLTGYGFGVSGDEFGGFGICFPYDEEVVTDKGKLKIGDVVENRIPCMVLSRNLEKGVDEFKPIDDWKKNPSSDLYKVVLNNGGYVECTPDHRFWTVNRGYVEARDLDHNDILLCSSDSLDLVNGKSKFFGYLGACVVFIKDKFKILFRKANSLFRGVIDFFSKSFKRCTFFDRYNSCLADTIRLSDFGNGACVSSDIDNIGRGEFGVAKTDSSLFSRILHIVRFRSISKVTKRVVSWIAVKVSNFNPFCLLTDKCPHHRLVNVYLLYARVCGSIKKCILSICSKFKDFLGNCVNVIKLIFNSSFFTSNSTQTTNTVDALKTRYCSPLFVYRIGHIDNSYCLTIRDNHNMYVGRSQEIIAKNCDDPNKPSLVKSQSELQNTIDLYVNAFKSRANNQAKSSILLIMQRVSVDDLTGYVLENESDDWDVIKIPALNEETGEALWEEKFPAKELLKLKEQSPFVFYSQYQQEPIVLGGSVYKTEWFRYYNTSEPYAYQMTYFTADTAQKKGEANDFTVLQYWGKTVDNRLHLIDMVRGKFDASELREQIILFWEKWKGGAGVNRATPYGFYIEDKSSGIGVIQEIRKTYPLPIIPISRARYKEDGVIKSQDKYSRALSAIPYISNGWVYLPNSEKDDISSLLLSEAAAFRADLNHKHDDMIDPMNDAIDIAFGAMGISSIFI